MLGEGGGKNKLGRRETQVWGGGGGGRGRNPIMSPFPPPPPPPLYTSLPCIYNT